MDHLPFDVNHGIVRFLSLEDFSSLGQVNQNYHNMLKNELMLRDCVKNNIAYSTEIRLTPQPTHSDSLYRAVQRGYKRRQAIINASPYAVAVVGSAESFLYENGHLCYLNRGQIVIIDLCSWSSREIVINLANLLLQREKITDPMSGLMGWKILTYSDNRVVCRWNDKACSRKWLLVIALDREQSDPSRYTLLQHRLPPNRYIVKVCKNFLCVGIRPAVQSYGSGWEFRTYSLLNTDEESQSFDLLNVSGSDLGTNIAFEIFQDHLYVVSNQPSSDDHLKWISYYHCMHISLTEPQARVREKKIWRRNHTEGPLMDSWVQLSLEQDEKDGKIYISETRKEWPGSGSFSTRLHYRCKFPIGITTATESDPSSEGSTKSVCRLPDVDAPLRKRLKRNVHQERANEEDSKATQPDDFILARSQYQFYDSGSMSFIDIIRDNTERQTLKPLQSHLSLRVASRKRKSPYIDGHVHNLLQRTELVESTDSTELPGPSNGKDIEEYYHEDYQEESSGEEKDKDDEDEDDDDEEEDFTPTQFNIWPSKDAPDELFDLLDATTNLQKTKVMGDNRNIVFQTSNQNMLKMFKIARGPPLLVVISFDPACNFPGLKYLPSDSASASFSSATTTSPSASSAFSSATSSSLSSSISSPSSSSNSKIRKRSTKSTSSVISDDGSSRDSKSIRIQEPAVDQIQQHHTNNDSGGEDMPQNQNQSQPQPQPRTQNSNDGIYHERPADYLKIKTGFRFR